LISSFKTNTQNRVLKNHRKHKVTYFEEGSMGKDLQKRFKSLRIISFTFMKGKKSLLNEMQSIFKVNLLQFCNTSSLFLLLKERFCPTKIGKKKTPRIIKASK
jgi:hypothetical protein